MVFFKKIHGIVKQNMNLIRGSLFAMYSFINKGFSFLLLLLLANYISPTEYGYLSLFSTVVMVIGYFMAMSTEGYLGIAYFESDRNSIKYTFSSVFFTTLISLSIFLSVFYVTRSWISSLLDLPSSVILSSVFICLFGVFTNLNLDIFRLKENILMYGLLSCGNAILNFFVSILLVKTMMYGWEGRVYAQLFCTTLFGCIGLFYFLKRGLLDFPPLKYWKDMLLWGIPLIPHLATTFIRQGCDRYIINYFHSVTSVGLFSFALNLCNLIMMIGLGFNQSNSVEIYKILSKKEYCNEEKSKLLNMQRNAIFKVFLVSTAMVTLVCSFVIPLILPKYGASVPYFVLLAIYAFLFCIYLLYTNYLFYFKKTKSIMCITFATSLIHLFLSLCFTRFGLFATALIYIFTQTLIVFMIRKKAIENLSIHGITI